MEKGHRVEQPESYYIGCHAMGSHACVLSGPAGGEAFFFLFSRSLFHNFFFFLFLLSLLFDFFHSLICPGPPGSLPLISLTNSRPISRRLYPFPTQSHLILLVGDSRSVPVSSVALYYFLFFLSSCVDPHPKLIFCTHIKCICLCIYKI